MRKNIFNKKLEGVMMKKFLKFFNRKYIASLSYVKYYEKLKINENIYF